MLTNRKSPICLKSLVRVLIIIGLLILIFQTSSIIRVFGYSGTFALEFDGVTDYVDLPAASDIIGPDWQSTKTITLWVKPTGPSPVVNDVFAGDLIFGDFPRWMGIYQANFNTEDSLWVINHDREGGVGLVKIGIPYTIGEWAHIALSHGNDILKAYKNGLEIGSETSYETASGHSGAIGGIIFRIGGSTNNAFNINFAGQIDEVRIYSRTLTTEEIRQDMYRTLIPGEDETLSAWYQMSNGSGTILADDSGNGHDGIFIDDNGPDDGDGDGDYAEWIESGALAGPRNALDFDGTDDYVSIPADINMPAEFTLEAWIYSRDTSIEQKWIVGENGGAQLTMEGTTVQFSIYDGSTLQGPATATIAANQWQHVAGIFDGSTLRIFVNGVEGTPFSFSGSNQDRDGIFSIGSLDNAVKGNDIIVDEVRLWDHDRSIGDLRQGMLTAMEGTETGLLAYYRFDQDADAAGSNTLYDITDQGNDGTLTNMDASTDWISSTAFHTWIGTESTDWSQMGNWSTYAVPGTGDHVGIFNNTDASNAPVINGSVTVNNLVVAPHSVLNVTSSGSVTVDDSLFNYGTLVQTKPVSGSSDIAFFDTGGYGGVLINPNGQDLGDTVVQITGGWNCLEFEDTVTRCFDISPANLPAGETTLTFFFDSIDLGLLNCEVLNVYHDNNGAWELMTLDTTYDDDGRMCGSDPQSVRITGVTNYSGFVILEQEPTAITVDSFTASPVSVVIFPILGLFGVIGLAIVFIIKNSPN